MDSQKWPFMLIMRILGFSWACSHWVKALLLIQYEGSYAPYRRMDAEPRHAFTMFHLFAAYIILQQWRHLQKVGALILRV
jgi:hypothetical protein